MSDTFSITLGEMASRMQLTQQQRRQMFQNRRDDEVLYTLPANTVYTLHWRQRPERAEPASVPKQKQKRQPKQQTPTAESSDSSESDEDILDRMRYVPVLEHRLV